MISELRSKGDQTRKKCLEGVRGLLARVDKHIELMDDHKLTGTVTLEINSSNGIISAVESTSRRAVPHVGGIAPRKLLGEIMDQLDSLALPDCHRAIRIEIVSVNGALSAIDIESTRHRWDV